MDNKMEHIVISFLNREYGECKEYRIPKFPDSLYYVNDSRVFMERNLLNSDLWIDYDTIWSEMENIFNLPYMEIKRIIKKWAQETYHLDRPNPMGIKRRDNKYVVENID